LGWRRRDRAIDLIDPFGFSGNGAFPLRKPRFGLLDSLGFPWILSSESRLFNGLRVIFAVRVFSALFGGVKRRGDRSLRSLHTEAQNYSWDKRNLISDFLQDIVVRAVPFGRLNPKATR
jgi:hypothetical protein